MEDLKNDLTYEVLVLGLGNLLMSDDGIGCYVAEELRKMNWPPGVLILETRTSVINYLEEISHSRHLIAVDAVQAGGKFGSVYRFTVENIVHGPAHWRGAHGLTLPGVIELARITTGFPRSITIYGLEPVDLSLGTQLSPAVKKALPRVIDEVAKEIYHLILREY